MCQEEQSIVGEGHRMSFHQHKKSFKKVKTWLSRNQCLSKRTKSPSTRTKCPCKNPKCRLFVTKTSPQIRQIRSSPDSNRKLRCSRRRSRRCKRKGIGERIVLLAGPPGLPAGVPVRAAKLPASFVNFVLKSRKSICAKYLRLLPCLLFLLIWQTFYSFNLKCFRSVPCDFRSVPCDFRDEHQFLGHSVENNCNNPGIIFPSLQKSFHIFIDDHFLILWMRMDNDGP